MTDLELRNAMLSLGSIAILISFALFLGNRCDIRRVKIEAEREKLYEIKIQSCIDDSLKRYQCKNWIK